MLKIVPFPGTSATQILEGFSLRPYRDNRRRATVDQKPSWARFPWHTVKVDPLLKIGTCEDEGLRLGVTRTAFSHSTFPVPWMKILRGEQ